MIYIMREDTKDFTGKIVCFYHGDMDGIATAFGYSKVMCRRNRPDAHDYHVIQYSDKVDAVMEKIGDNEGVVFVDFCPSTELVDAIVAKGTVNRLEVIDHHEGAAGKIRYIVDNDSCPILNKEVYYLTDAKGAASMPYAIVGASIPLDIELIGNRDVWDFSDIRAAYYHEWAVNLGPSISDWKAWFQVFSGYKDELVAQIDIGEKLVARRDIVLKEAIESRMMMCQIGNVMLPCINSTEHISELGNLLAKQAVCGAGLVWHRRKDSVSLSFRSVEGSSVSAFQLAKAYGGGGHRNAAGATISSDKFSFLLAGMQP